MMHTVQLLDRHGGPIRLVRAVERGLSCWFYVRLNPLHATAYRSALRQGDCNLKDFGDILQSGWGQFPPEKVVQHMRERYGFETSTQV